MPSQNNQRVFPNVSTTAVWAVTGREMGAKGESGCVHTAETIAHNAVPQGELLGAGRPRSGSPSQNIKRSSQYLLSVTALVVICFYAAACLRGRSVHAQTSDALPSFEVASIHADHSGTNDWSIKSTPSSWTCNNAPLEALLRIAFKVKAFQVVSAPEWIHSERYTIEARYPEAFQQLAESKKSQEEGLMLQDLLAHRFNLRYHRASRQMVVYALVAAKGGAKLPTAAPGDNGSAVEYGAYMQVRGYTMGEFAQQLSATLGQTVVDKTNLPGKYSFTLRYPPPQVEDDGGGVGGNSDAEKQARIYSGLQEQLGLKLQAQKGPVPILVIDNVERSTPN